MPAPPEPATDMPDASPTRSTRDREALRTGLEQFFTETIPGSDPHVGRLDTPGSTGMSSETLLFDLSWTQDGQRRSGGFVARVAPDPADVPIFPTYDLEMQFRLLRLVDEHTAVQVPRVRWIETTGEVIGAPFFVMERVAGRVPTDIPPYTMGGWLFDASDDERRTLQDRSVEILANLHALDIAAHDLDYLEFDVPGDTPLRRHVENQRAFYEWARGDDRNPIIEAALSWLDDHWPGHEADPVVSWGDARIGNVIYDGFVPAAVLDWEMAGLAPREVDVGWMCFFHIFWQDITTNLGMTGLPDFMRIDDVRATYERATGVELDDLRWYVCYGALRHAIIMTRVSARSVHFGEAERSDDPDAGIIHRNVLEQMIDGSWWD